MAVLLSPIGNGQQFFDNLGYPLNGGLIYTYFAGSTTPATTYTEVTGTVANTNPIVCDSSGRLQNEIWLTEGYSYKFIIQTSAGVTLQTVDNIYPILQNAAGSGATIPAGLISMWAGSIGSIPLGWYLCDGNNGTPDLRDRFIVGAGSSYAVNATGGSASVTPTGTIIGTVGGTSLTEAQMPKHYHLMLGPNNVSSPQGSGSGVGVYGGGTPDDGTQAYGTYSTGGDAASGTQTTGTSNADSHDHSFVGTFTGASATNLPPYYALAYIMKA